MSSNSTNDAQQETETVTELAQEVPAPHTHPKPQLSSSTSKLQRREGGSGTPIAVSASGSGSDVGCAARNDDAALIKPKPMVDESTSAQQTTTSATVPEVPTTVVTCLPAEAVVRPVQTNTSRCWECNRKIGLTGLQCKCEYFFCAQHRYSDLHNCSFDFKGMGKAQLQKANPVVAPAKVGKF